VAALYSPGDGAYSYGLGGGEELSLMIADLDYH